ncbi:glutathione S-transferase family protein [Enhygromyxa salina]|uniref:Glutathione S-transferase n=1 Tax=Enhygromyxa salina TaxID=215803 RepID=A0A2S9YKD3_9BACT|nr:glutathione S-transferase family protein [Enhygromyxa salina]PRQ05561.1 Glutathione S-transferase [Enhygromyxa salina]
MTKPKITGFPQSTFVWTARAAFNIKGVDHDFEPIGPPQSKTPEYLARHPWGKVPVLDHGDVALYETTAICSYVDTAFEGTSLQPSEPAELARMHQVVSIANCYLYPPAVLRYALQFIFPSGPDGTPNRAVIDKALPEIGKTLGVLEAELGDGEWFAGGQLTIADLFVGPLVAVVGMFPEGKQLLADQPKLGRLLGRLMDQPGFRDAAPKPG